MTTWNDTPILDHHAAKLDAAAITAETALRLGIHSALSIEHLHDVGGPYPALVYPWRSPDGRVEYQTNPDHPDLDNETHKPRKYLWRRGYVPMLWKLSAGSGDVVWIVEGTKQALAAETWKPAGVEVYGIAGCWSWSHEGNPIGDLAVAKGKDVVVILDGDAAGNRNVYDGGMALAKALKTERAASVKFTRFPTKTTQLDEVLGGRSPSARTDYLEGLTCDAETKPADKRPPARAKLSPSRGRPMVIVNDDRLTVIEGLTMALRAAGDGSWLFNHGGVLARLDGAELVTVGRDEYRDLLPRVVRTVSQADNGTLKDAWPELMTLQAVATRAHEFTPVDRVTRTPFVREDGSICQAPGYDAASRTVLVPAAGFEEVDIPEEPSGDEVASARKLLMDEWLGDMPFAESADRANALALVLTPFVRGLVPRVPLAVVDGRQPGVGKNLFADVLSILVTGEMADPKSYTYDEDEQRKAITSAFRAGGDLFVFDEAHVLAGTPLARALTASTYSDRILGTSIHATFPNRVTWVSLGNNVQLRGDIGRRVYRIRLAPNVADPADRPETDFAHPDLASWTSEHRAELVTAALVIVRAWFAAGKPGSVRGGSFGSFEAWGRMLGGILDLVGMPDFLTGTRQWRSESDEEASSWLSHVTWLAAVFGDEPFTSRQAKDAALSDPTGYEAPLGLDNVMDRGYAKALGQTYARMSGRVVSGFRLEKKGFTHNHVALWAVRTDSSENGAENTGDPGGPLPPIPPSSSQNPLSVNPVLHSKGSVGVTAPPGPRSPHPSDAGSTDPGMSTQDDQLEPSMSVCKSEVIGQPSLGLAVFDVEAAEADRLHTYGPGYVRIAGWTEDGSIKITTDLDAFAARLQGAEMVVGHNIVAYDLPALTRYHGLDMVELVNRGAVYDTLLAARHLDPPPARTKAPRRYDLDTLGERYELGSKAGDLKALAKAHGGYDAIPLDDPDYLAYLTQDVRLGAAVFAKMWVTDPYLDREHRVAMIAAQLGLNGFRIDTELLSQRCAEGDARKAAALAQLAERYDVPMTKADGKPAKSPLATKTGKEAVADAFTRLGADPRLPRTPKTQQLRTDSDAMAVVKLMAPGNTEVARLADLVTVVTGERTIYHTIDNWTHEGRVYPGVSMDQATGRWSVTKPGLTVVGKRGGRHRERDVFLPEPGHVIVTVDLSQVDARAVAAHSGDVAYRAMFAPGRDLHAEVAQRVWGDAEKREEAKAIGHGWNYGMGVDKLGTTTGLGIQAAHEFDQAMRAMFPRLVQWREEVAEWAGSGQLLDNGFGRKMRPDPRRAYTQGPAFMGQGTARDLMMEGLLKLPREVYPYLRAQVHDEVVCSVPADIATDVERVLVEAMTFEWGGVDIVAEAGRRGQTWGQCYDKDQ